jgi:hypothetical protein
MHQASLDDTDRARLIGISEGGRVKNSIHSILASTMLCQLLW